MVGKEAILYEPMGGAKVRCTACARYCQIPDGKPGLCGVRANVGGKLQLLVYGKVITGHVDPIEKKPVSHFMPGTKIFSIATTGCNWLCHYCQNYDISQRRKVEGSDLEPLEVVNLAKQYGSHGIAYTYNQPTIFLEFARDIGVLARKEGLINIFVSNGYDTEEAVCMMNEFLDCITVDFKGSGETGFVRKYIGIQNAEPIYQTLLELKQKTKIHIEITDLIIPELGDSLEAARKLCKWVSDNLGPDTPVHFLRFHPDYKLMHLPKTPTETLEKHHQIGKDAGLNYVYIGNVPNHPLQHTYCPGCGELVVERLGFKIGGWNMDAKNRCLRCGYKIAITGTLNPANEENRFIPIRI